MSSPLASTPVTEFSPSDEAVGHSPGSLLPRLQLKHLDHEIAKLTEQRNKIALSIFPLRLLNRDIIQEIFIACLPAERNCAMSALEAPVLLGRVCSSWRTISLSTPRLWARLHIVEPTSVEFKQPISLSLIQAKVEQRIQVTKTWLGRSGECPLSISFQGKQDSPLGLWGPSGVNGTVFLEAILPFAPRWRRISFTSPLTPAMFRMLSKLTETDLPMLQGLSFRGVFPVERDEIFTFQWGQLRMIGAPCLTHFSLQNSNFVPDTLPVRWEHLTYLVLHSLESLPSDVILRTISKCPGLLSCDYEINIGTTVARTSARPAITIPSLQAFTLRFDHSPSAINLLDHLAFPHLRSLSILGAGKQDQQQSIRHFFAVSTQLERLHIHSQPFSSSFLCRILRSLPPTVQHLEFEDPSIPPILDGSESGLNDDVLTALLPDPASPYPCPALRTLIIDPCIISDEAVLHFLRARMAVEPRPSLKSVHIGFDRLPGADLRPQLHLQPLVDAGLDLSITYVPPSFSPWLGLRSEAGRLSLKTAAEAFVAISPPPTSALSTYLEQIGVV